MRIYIEVDKNYVLLDKEKQYSNCDYESDKIEMLEEAISKLDEAKKQIEIIKSSYKIKKLGLHPSTKKAS